MACASAFLDSPTSSTWSATGSCPSSTLLFSSAMDQFSGLDGDADLLPVTLLEADAARLAASGRDGDLRNMQRRFPAIDPALRVRLRGFAVARVDVDPRYDHLAL